MGRTLVVEIPDEIDACLDWLTSNYEAEETHVVYGLLVNGVMLTSAALRVPQFNTLHQAVQRWMEVWSQEHAPQWGRAHLGFTQPT